MAKKWIINDGAFKMSASVQYHRELATNHDTTQGGGFWAMDEPMKILYLWGASSDFGYAEPETVSKAFKEGRVSSRLNGYIVKKSPIISPTLPSLESFEPIWKIES